jgi:hypothetical protein
MLECGAMLERLGINTRAQTIVFGALTMLLFITPLGKEASHPITLGIYRTLLFLIAIVAIRATSRDGSSRICPYFLASCTVALFLMGASILLTADSRFEGA